MAVPQVHCNIDEKMLSLTVFLTRVLSGSVMLYVGVGCLLFYREFLYNAAALGVPMPIHIGVGLVVAELIVALLLLLGWFTRWAAGVGVLCTAGVAVIFFAADFNKIYVALLMLLISSLLPAALLGPGRISLDFTHARRKAEQAFRG